MKKFASIFSWGLAIGLLVATALAWFMRQDIYDWYRLRGYQAPSQVAKLATETTMNSDSRRLFYVYRPQLNDRVAFNQNCTHDEQTIVLGCYVSNVGIYLFDIHDPRLEGVEQVTAAHELLHAAYDRLNKKKKKLYR